MDVKEKIKTSLEKIRPMLQMDGGDVQFVDFDEKTGVVDVELTGHCAHCPMAAYTLKGGVEAQLKEDVLEVKEVRNIEHI